MAAAVVLAAASVIVFFVTEDLTNTMAFTDRYTLIMALILIGSAASVILGNKKESPEADAEENA